MSRRSARPDAARGVVGTCLARFVATLGYDRARSGHSREIVQIVNDDAAGVAIVAPQRAVGRAPRDRGEVDGQAAARDIRPALRRGEATAKV
jgi:hypothetical protein